MTRGLSGNLDRLRAYRVRPVTIYAFTDPARADRCPAVGGRGERRHGAGGDWRYNMAAEVIWLLNEVSGLARG